MSVTIVFGNQSCGKTRRADLLRSRFQARRVLDGWSPSDPRSVRDGDLLITNSLPPFEIHDAHVINYEDIKGELVS